MIVDKNKLSGIPTLKFVFCQIKFPGIVKNSKEAIKKSGI